MVEGMVVQNEINWENARQQEKVDKVIEKIESDKKENNERGRRAILRPLSSLMNGQQH